MIIWKNNFHFRQVGVHVSHIMKWAERSYRIAVLFVYHFHIEWIQLHQQMAMPMHESSGYGHTFHPHHQFLFRFIKRYIKIECHNDTNANAMLDPLKGIFYSPGTFIAFKCCYNPQYGNTTCDRSFFFRWMHGAVVSKAMHILIADRSCQDRALLHEAQRWPAVIFLLHSLPRWSGPFAETYWKDAATPWFALQAGCRDRSVACRATHCWFPCLLWGQVILKGLQRAIYVAVKFIDTKRICY